MKTKRFIPHLVDAVVICFFILAFSPLCNSADITNPTDALVAPQIWTLSITEEGQLEINGIPIEKMSDPEIKAAVKEMAAAMKKQAENDELVKHYDRQTGYLLQELEKCLKSR